MFECQPPHQRMCHIHSIIDFNSVSEFVCNCKSIYFNRLTSDIEHFHFHIFFFSLFTINPKIEYYYLFYLSIKLSKLESHQTNYLYRLKCTPIGVYPFFFLLLLLKIENSMPNHWYSLLIIFSAFQIINIYVTFEKNLIYKMCFFLL